MSRAVASSLSLALSLALSIALILAMSAGCAHLGAGRGWDAYESPYFVAYTAPADDGRREVLAEEVLETLHRARAAYAASYFRDVELPLIDVVVLDGASPALPRGVGGAVVPAVVHGARIGQQGLMVLSPSAPPEVAAELLSHLFVERAVPAAPPWVHHGVAAALARVEYRLTEGAVCFSPRKPPSAAPALLPLDALFAARNGGSDAAALRWTSWQLFDLLLDRRGRDPVHGVVALSWLLDRLRERADPRAALAGALRRADAGGIEAAVAAHAAAPKTGCGARFIVPTEARPRDPSRRSRQVPRSEIEAAVASIQTALTVPGAAAWTAPLD